MRDFAASRTASPNRTTFAANRCDGGSAQIRTPRLALSRAIFNRTGGDGGCLTRQPVMDHMSVRDRLRQASPGVESGLPCMRAVHHGRPGRPPEQRPRSSATERMPSCVKPMRAVPDLHQLLRRFWDVLAAHPSAIRPSGENYYRRSRIFGGQPDVRTSISRCRVVPDFSVTLVAASPRRWETPTALPRRPDAAAVHAVLVIGFPLPLTEADAPLNHLSMFGKACRGRSSATSRNGTFRARSPLYQSSFQLGVRHAAWIRPRRVRAAEHQTPGSSNMDKTDRPPDWLCWSVSR